MFPMIETLRTALLPGAGAVLEKVVGLVDTFEELGCENVSPLWCRDVQQYLRLIGVCALDTFEELGSENVSLLQCREIQQYMRLMGACALQ